MTSIIYDARHLTFENTGLSRYSEKLLLAILNMSQSFESIIILMPDRGLNFEERYKKIIRLAKNRLNTKLHWTRCELFSFRNYFMFWREIKAYKGYTYFYPHFDSPFCFGLFKKVFVVHDLFPLVVKGYIVRFSLVKKLIFYVLCSYSLYSSSTCICVSRSTLNDLNSWFPFFSRSNRRVVHSAGALDEGCEDDSLCISNNKYLLYVGDRRPHKNLAMMINIYRVLRQVYKYDGEFLLAGSSINFGVDLDELISDTEGVIYIGAPNEAQLRSLYKNMHALFFLSKYEGFGLPILEAARFNKKIISSNVSSIPEVAPPSALLIDPDGDATEAASLMHGYLSDENNLSDSRRHISNFTWEETAKKIFFPTLD